MEMIFSFLLGFISVWFITKNSLTLSKKTNHCPMKDSIVNDQFYREIAVSNTFTQEWEMDPYFEIAK